MRNTITILVLILTISFAKAQVGIQIYKEAFDTLNYMLNDKSKIIFKKAVFTVENAYFNNTLDLNYYNYQIHSLTQFSREIIESRTLLYDQEDKPEVEKYSAIFSLMSDSIPIQIDSNQLVYHQPYTYDFNDIWGNQSWKNMFVTKLLDTKKGNCHSLPFLYKILIEEDRKSVV